MSLNILIGQHSVSGSKICADIAKAIAAANLRINVNPGLVSPLLCEAYENGLIWPKYVWILHSYRLDVIVSHNPGEECDRQSILKGVIIFQLTNKELTSESGTDEQVSARSGLRELNPYTNLLYDSVWTLASSNHSLSAQSTLTNSHNNIYQFLNGTSSSWIVATTTVNQRHWKM